MFVASCSVSPNNINHVGLKRDIQFLCKNKRINTVHLFCTTKVEVPSWIKDNDKISFQICEDFGPLTKVAPLFDLYEPLQDMGVILFDEDVGYPEGWFDGLMDSYDRHNRTCAVGRQGSMHKYLPFRYDVFGQDDKKKDDEPFLTLKTKYGVIYPFQCFPPSSEVALEFLNKYKNQNSYLNQDLLYASWCFKGKTSLYVIPTSEENVQAWFDQNSFRCKECKEKEDVVKELNNTTKQIHLAATMMAKGDFPVPWADVGTIAGLIVSFLFLVLFFVLMVRL